LQFEVGDFVYLRVSPIRGVQQFGIKGKLAPRCVRPFEILETCGHKAYCLQLPYQLAAIHNIFHVSQLKKCIKIPTEVINFQTIKIEPDLSYTGHPIRTQEEKQSGCLRSNGTIILKKKRFEKLNFIFSITSRLP
jgi:hypothetical protein